MIRNLFLMILIVSAFSFDFSDKDQKGTGISDDELNHINDIIKAGRLIHNVLVYDLAVYIKGQLQASFGQYWLVQIANATNLIVGTYGGVYIDDQWLKLRRQNGVFFYWISVPASTKFYSYDIPLKQTSFISNLFQKEQNIHATGKGITPSQQKAIQNIMKNAELSNPNDPQACAEVIGKKIEDSFGQNWIVEIYGSNQYNLNWGRALLKFTNDQWLSYVDYEIFLWHYLIWVPGY